MVLLEAGFGRRSSGAIRWRVFLGRSGFHFQRSTVKSQDVV
jgi:hypothetical protein